MLSKSGAPGKPTVSSKMAPKNMWATQIGLEGLKQTKMVHT